MKDKKIRPVYIIEHDIRVAIELASKAAMEGRYVNAVFLSKKIETLKDELNDAMDRIKFDDDNRNMDKSLRSWFGKILSLSLNEADMSLYHLDMFFAYMLERGYIPTPEWARKRRELCKAVTEYRDFVKHFFKDENNLVNSEVDFMHLLEVVRDRIFTDREKQYYDKYEIKAAHMGKSLNHG